MLHELLERNPVLIRLLRSGQAALPVTINFWEDLAYGIGLKVDDVRSGLGDLYGEGLSSGFWGEPNPAHPELAELLVRGCPDCAGAAVRFRIETEVGQLTSLVGARQDLAPLRGEGASPSTQWLKTGFSPNLSLPEQENLLEAGADRSTLIKEQAAARPIEEDDRAVWSLLCEPLCLLPPESPWEQIAHAGGLGPGEVRLAIQRLMVSRVWRRFALKLNPTAMGWEGCGLACWRLPEEDAPKAANAVSLIRGSGDVCLREPTEFLPYNLVVLLIGRHPDSGLRAAREISRRWRVELGRFLPARFL